MGFYLFGTFIPYYGFFILVGIVCATFIGFLICKNQKLNADDFIIVCAYLIAFGFLGAKILYLIVSFQKIDFKLLFCYPKKFNTIISSGFVFYGGFFGGIFSLFFVRKIHKIKTENYLKCIVPPLGIAHGFGRIGCSLAGCCYGKETVGNFYFIYKDNPISPNDTKLFPIQGIEALCLFALGIICLILVLKKSNIKIHLFYAFCYSIIRFILEFFRGDKARGFISIFSTSQIFSLIIIIVVCLIAAYHHKINKKDIHQIYQ